MKTLLAASNGPIWIGSSKLTIVSSPRNVRRKADVVS
jgi:hypothetical protein